MERRQMQKMKNTETNETMDEFDNLKTKKKILLNFQKDFTSFRQLVEEKSKNLEEELEELLILNNKDLMESMKRADEDIKAGRVTACRTDKEIDDFFDSL